jgi:hypothetical protein
MNKKQRQKIAGELVKVARFLEGDTSKTASIKDKVDVSNYFPRALRNVNRAKKTRDNWWLMLEDFNVPMNDVISGPWGGKEIVNEDGDKVKMVFSTDSLRMNADYIKKFNWWPEYESGVIEITLKVGNKPENHFYMLKRDFMEDFKSLQKEYGGSWSKVSSRQVVSEELPTKRELEHFYDYAMDFYGRGGISEITKGGRPLHKRDLIKATWNVLTNKRHPWGGGDSMDREAVASVLLSKYGYEWPTTNASMVAKKEERMDIINRIVKNRQHEKVEGMIVDLYTVEGMIVDLYTASLLKQVYDGVNRDLQKKIDKGSLKKFVDVAYKLTK